MMYPLVAELAADGHKVQRCCDLLGFTRKSYYKWRQRPYSDRDWDNAHLANAALDVHNEVPEFGYRLISDELNANGVKVHESRLHRVCRDNGIHSTIHSRTRKNPKKPGPPVHDDLAQRDFNAEGPNELWLTDITEHPTAEGKLYMCAIKDVWSKAASG